MLCVFCVLLSQCGVVWSGVCYLAVCMTLRAAWVYLCVSLHRSRGCSMMLLFSYRGRATWEEQPPAPALFCLGEGETTRWMKNPRLCTSVCIYEALVKVQSGRPYLCMLRPVYVPYYPGIHSPQAFSLVMSLLSMSGAVN